MVIKEDDDTRYVKGVTSNVTLPLLKNLGILSKKHMRANHTQESYYMRQINSIEDYLTYNASPTNSEELFIMLWSGLGPKYKELSAAIRAGDNPITFEELFDKLLS